VAGHLIDLTTMDELCMGQDTEEGRDLNHWWLSHKGRL
jgi:hypothetical protein